MPGKFIFLLNAAIFGSLAALGSNAHRSFDANAFSQGPKAAKPSITTKSVTTQPVSPHGLAHSTALLPGALNNSWEYVEQDLTLVTIPGASHFVQQDASNMVTRTMKMWLNR